MQKNVGRAMYNIYNIVTLEIRTEFKPNLEIDSPIEINISTDFTFYILYLSLFNQQDL